MKRKESRLLKARVPLESGSEQASCVGEAVDVSAHSVGERHQELCCHSTF